MSFHKHRTLRQGSLRERADGDNLYPEVNNNTFFMATLSTTSPDSSNILDNKMQRQDKNLTICFGKIQINRK